MKKGWVYILKCADNSYYTGSTTDIHFRLLQHKSGEGAEWTKKRLPVKLGFKHEFATIEEAFKIEKIIKKWSRAKKEALIANDIDLLRYFAKKPVFRSKK